MWHPGSSPASKCTAQSRNSGISELDWAGRRPRWPKLQRAIDSWRLDRLGRTAKGPLAPLNDLPRKGVGLVSLKGGLELATPAGRLMANVLASVAQYETEVRAERVLAGQAKAKATGKTWGGSKAGRLLSVIREQVAAIVQMHGAGVAKAKIARATGVSRPTVYRVLEQRA